MFLNHRRYMLDIWRSLSSIRLSPKTASDSFSCKSKNLKANPPVTAQSRMCIEGWWVLPGALWLCYSCVSGAVTAPYSSVYGACYLKLPEACVCVCVWGAAVCSSSGHHPPLLQTAVTHENTRSISLPVCPRAFSLSITSFLFWPLRLHFYMWARWIMVDVVLDRKAATV